MKQNDLFIFADSGRRIEFFDSYTMLPVFYTTQSIQSILRYVYEITDPILNLCGRFMPDALRYPLDFTPMVALVVIQLVYQVLVMVLHVLF